jgi:hypothetical protein
MTKFDKMHGLGNDFVILDAREQAVAMTPALAQALADRNTGIGCDQLILLEPSKVADLRMRIWNLDGGEVQCCGNASRCVVAFTEGTAFDIQSVGSVKSMLFGGEGVFLATLSGPGKVWIQSLPFSRLAGRMLSAAYQTGGGRDEGSVLGGLGGLISGDRNF